MALDDILKTTFDTTIKNLSPGSDVLQAPIAKMLLALGYAIADGQQELDKNSIKTSLLLGSSVVDLKDKNGATISRSLLELGFTPTFYHFSEATLTVNVTLSFKVEESVGFSVGLDPNKASGNKGTSTPSSGASTVTVTVKSAVAAGAKLELKKGSAALESFTFAKVAEGIALSSSNETQAKLIAEAIGNNADLKKTIKASATGAKVDIRTVDPMAPAATIAVNNEEALEVKIGDSVTVKDYKKLKAGDTIKIESTTLTVVEAPAKGAIPITAAPADQAKAIADAVQGSTALKDQVVAKAEGSVVTLSLGKDVKDEITVTSAGDALELKGSKLSPAAAPATSGAGSGAAPAAGAAADPLSGVGKGLAALGVSASVEYHRKYNFDTSTTSKVEAKLVSLPPPTVFLDAIRTHFGV